MELHRIGLMGNSISYFFFFFFFLFFFFCFLSFFLGLQHCMNCHSPRQIESCDQFLAARCKSEFRGVPKYLLSEPSNCYAPTRMTQEFVIVRPLQSNMTQRVCKQRLQDIPLCVSERGKKKQILVWRDSKPASIERRRLLERFNRGPHPHLWR
jgi:hypothetical protein